MYSRVGFSVFATAIAVSAVAHALVLSAFRVVRFNVAHPPAAYSEMTVVYHQPEARPSFPDGSEFEIGKPLGKGYATHESPGRRAQVAREAPQDQASLSLDPIGDARDVEVPSAPAEVSQAPAPIALLPPAVAGDRVPSATPVLSPDVEQSVRRDRIEIAVAPTPGEVSPPQVVAVDVSIPPPVVTMPAPQRLPQRAPSPVAGTGADLAPQSNSESDAFSLLGSVQYRSGRVTVQSGRQVKTRRPKIGLAGMVELAQRNTAQVELNVSVDSTGAVTNVEVARSSGSNNIDQPCRVAMYDWWFEPKKDAAGKPAPDRFRFTISFR